MNISPFQVYLETIEFSLKRSLRVGEKLHHHFIGDVIFDEQCKHLELIDGDSDGIFVSRGSEIVQVTLALISRYDAHGNKVRMIELTPTIKGTLSLFEEPNSIQTNEDLNKKITRLLTQIIGTINKKS